MGALIDRLQSELTDLDTQMANEQKRSAELIVTLKTRKQALKEAAKIVTPELEAAVLMLKSLGMPL